MNDRLDLLVTDWLHSDAPTSASPRVLEGALARVATSGQERYVTQRLLGDAVGRRRDVRLALAVFLVVLGLVGAVAVIGALLPKETIPVGPLSNGPIVFRANGEAGADLAGQVQDARNGEADVYAVDGAGGIRRILGDDTDHLLQQCPTASPDGSHLAYLELDSTSITPTLAPVPEGQSFGPNPTYGGPLRYAFEVVALDSSGAPRGQPIRIVPPGPPDSIVDCPRWAPDGRMLAFDVDPSDGSGLQLWVASLDGRTTRLAHGSFNPGRLGGYDWAPDGKTVVVNGESDAWLVPTDGGPARQLLSTGAGAVAWSPDGSRIAATTETSLVVVDPDGTELFRRAAREPGDPTLLWSPDGAWVAQVRDGVLTLDSADGRQTREVAIDVEQALGKVAAPDSPPSLSLVAWSPESDRLLVAAAVDFEVSGLLSIAARGDEPPVVEVPPTIALRGIRAGQATWLGVHR